MMTSKGSVLVVREIHLSRGGDELVDGFSKLLDGELILSVLDEFHHLGAAFFEGPLKRVVHAVGNLTLAKMQICIYVHRRFLNN